MIKKNDLKKIAKTRLEEARLLHQHGFYDGASYLCGYVLEVSLKAKICKNLGVDEYPDDNAHKQAFRVHDFDRLLLLSGLSSQVVPTNVDLFRNWSLLTKWKPEDRYAPIGSTDQAKSKDLLDALDDPNHGLLTYIKRRW